MKPIKATEHHDQPITQATLAEALTQGRKRSQCTLTATTVRYREDDQALMIGLADQTALLLPVGLYPELADLLPAELARIELGFGGSALCLESHDIHLHLAGMISDSKSLMDMAASVIAARNGRRSSSAKASASRANGLKGGRPRKLVDKA
jgi:hypothetical protein